MNARAALDNPSRTASAFDIPHRIGETRASLSLPGIRMDQDRWSGWSPLVKTLPLTRDETNAFDRTDQTLRRSWAEKVLLFTEGSHLRACAALLAICLLCFLPGLAGLQPLDRSEAQIAQVSRQMVESGDFLVPRFQNAVQHARPPGIHWLQSVSVMAAEALGVADARGRIAIYRIPSLIGAITTVLLTYWAALALARRREAFLAAAFVASSIILMLEARHATGSAVLLACMVAILGGLARCWLARGAHRLPGLPLLAFWSGLALGLLVAGPVVLVLAGLPILVLSIDQRSARWLGILAPRAGLPFLLLIFGAWIAAVAWHAGADFFLAAAAEVFARQAGPWLPPGTFLALFFVTFWPAAILCAIAVPFAWINRRADVVRFLIAFVLPAWLVFEIMPVKEAADVMPLYPAVAILTAIGLTRGFIGPHRRWAMFASLLLLLTPGLLAIGLPLAGRYMGDGLLARGMPLIFLAGLISLLAWFYFLKGAVIAAALTGVLSAMVLSVGVFGFVQPLLRSAQVSENLSVMRSVLECPEPAVATLGYREPSLVFLIGSDLAMPADGAEAVAFLSAGGCRMLFVERRHQRDFLLALDGTSVEPALVTRLRGFNPSERRHVDIGVYIVEE
jgi:4-amino-4-deoxy-L-arabinose transferase-like glycosyltransferase